MTILCSPHIYVYNGVTIGLGGIGGPYGIRPNGEAYIREPKHVREAVDAWWSLSKTEREQYRVGDGCQAWEP